MNNLIIANIGSGKKGKSSSIKEVYKLLALKYPDFVNIIHPLSSGDIQAVIRVKGVLVGIESQGDPNSRVFSSLDYFRRAGCQIIVVACRLYGNTADAVNDMHKFGYQVVWTANDKNWDDYTIVNYLNAKYAEHVVHLIEDRIEGTY